MHTGRCKSHWAHTSEILALIRNVNRDPKTPAISASVLNPYAPKADTVIPKVKMKDLKNMAPQIRNLAKKAGA